MNKEIWKDIANLKGKYQISNFGNVRHIKTKGIKILKSHKDKYGYQIITLFHNKKHHTYKIHRLVAEAFIPNPESKEQVNHIDFNRSNNCVNNLEWCSLQQNINYSKINNKYKNRDASKWYKKVNQYDKNGNFIKTWNCIREAGETLGIDRSGISAVCRKNGINKSCGGYVWEYKV